MQTYNINKEIQQIQNNIGIIISYFFIRQNQTLVPKIDPDYVNNQINNLSDKISKINGGGGKNLGILFSWECKFKISAQAGFLSTSHNHH